MLNLSNSGAIQNSTLVMNGGNLVFDRSVSGNAFTIGGLAAGSSGPGYDIALQNNAVSPAAVVLTVGQNNNNTGYAGAFSGNGSLVKIGSGTLTLTGASTYTGGTTVTGGILQIHDNAQLGTPPTSPTVNISLDGGEMFNANSSPVLDLNRTIYLGPNGGYFRNGWNQGFTIEGQITGPGGLGVVWDGGPFVLANGGNNYDGDTTIGIAGNGYNPSGANLTLGADNAIPFGPG